MKRIFRKIHLWLSVPFGVVIILVCFSGAMLVFENEITRLINNDIYKVEKTTASSMSIDAAAKIVAQKLPDNVRVTGVTVSQNPSDAYKINLSKPKRAAIYVDQYTGEIKGRQERPEFFTFMFRLHRWLLDSGKPEGRPAWGKIIVGVSTIMFVLALMSGIVIWWPKTRRALHNSMKITIRKGSFRLWRSLHVAGGMYAAALLLAMALTGLTWSFPWYRTAFYSVFGVEMAAKNTPHNGKKGKEGAHTKKEKTEGKRLTGTAQPDVWQNVYNRLRADNPSAESITIGDGTASVSFGEFGNTRAADNYTFDINTGSITSTTKYPEAKPSSKMRGWIYSVHAGTFGGLTTRILWFIAALLGAILPLTGYYLWIRRLSRKKSQTADAG